MFQTLCQAIQARSVLKLSMVNGETRIVEPHRYGARANHVEVLNAYQQNDSCDDHSSANWKMIPITEIAAAVATGATFSTPRTGYNPTDGRRIREIFAQI